jgi:hypothetical protein
MADKEGARWHAINSHAALAFVEIQHRRAALPLTVRARRARGWRGGSPRRPRSDPSGGRGLLAHPRRLERLSLACESLPAHESSTPHRPELPEAPVGLYAALLAMAPERHGGQHPVTGVDQLVDLSMGLVELAPPTVQELPEILRPAIQAPGAGDRVSGDVLELGRSVGEHALEIASVESLVATAHHFHGLPRHRLHPRAGCFKGLGTVPVAAMASDLPVTQCEDVEGREPPFYAAASAAANLPAGYYYVISVVEDLLGFKSVRTPCREPLGKPGLDLVAATVDLPVDRDPGGNLPLDLRVKRVKRGLIIGAVERAGSVRTSSTFPSDIAPRSISRQRPPLSIRGG